jgi:hypothetical protein
MSNGIYHVVSRSYFSVPPPMKLAHIHKHKKYLDSYRRVGGLVQQLKSLVQDILINIISTVELELVTNENIKKEKKELAEKSEGKYTEITGKTERSQENNICI